MRRPPNESVIYLADKQLEVNSKHTKRYLFKREGNSQNLCVPQAIHKIIRKFYTNRIGFITNVIFLNISQKKNFFIFIINQFGI